MAMKVLNTGDLEAYEKDGFLNAGGAVPDDLRTLCQQVLERWVDVMVAKWRDEGLIADAHPDLDFRSRYLVCWREAGMPVHERSPRKQLVQLEPEKMFDILRHPALLDLASDLLGTDEIISHGIWNSRPKAPDARFTDTPWHQDAQYFRDQAGTHIVTVWFPLHAVDAKSSCLAVAPGHHRDELYAGQSDADGTGFLGLTQDDAAKLTPHPVAMQAGDALCFSEMMPHVAMPNETEFMRWSMDLRFVSRATAKDAALEQGMIARCPSSPDQMTPYDEWVAKWPTGPGY